MVTSYFIFDPSRNYSVPVNHNPLNSTATIITNTQQYNIDIIRKYCHIQVLLCCKGSGATTAV